MAEIASGPRTDPPLTEISGSLKQGGIMPRMAGLAGRIPAPLLVVLLWACACWPWLSGKHYIPGDTVWEFFPQSSFVVSSLRNGDAPWWNPFINSGQPALGDPQSMIFVPHTVAGLLAGHGYDLRVFNITTLLCVLAGGLALQRYCRRTAGGAAMPILGAAVFMFGGVASSRLEHAPEIVSYSLLPLQLLALRALCLQPVLWRALLLALALLAGLLNPNQVVFLSVFALLPFALLHLWQAPARLRAMALAGLAGVLALAASSPLLSAMAEFLRLSTRPSLPLEASRVFSFPLFNAAGLFVPGLYGFMRPLRGFWAPTDTAEDYIYVGLIPLCIVAAALIRPHAARVITLLAAAMSVFWLVFSFGPNAPLQPWLFAHIPGFAGFRRPADGAFLMNFSLAVAVGAASLWPRAAPLRGAFRLLSFGAVAAVILLAALAAWSLWQYGMSLGHGGDLWFVARQFSLRAGIIAIALLLVWLARRRMPGAAAPVLVGLAFLDLLTAGRLGAVNAPSYAESGAARYLEKPHTVSREAISRTLVFLQAHGATDPHHPIRVEILGSELSGNLLQVSGISLTGGYTPLMLAEYARAFGTVSLAMFQPKQFYAAAPGYDSDLYRRLGVRYVLLDRDTLDNKTDQGLAERVVKLGLATSPWAQYEGTAGSYEVWQLRDAMAKGNVDIPGAPPTPCAVLAYRNVSMHLRCTAAAPGRLVIGDIYAPGWIACVNGAPAEITPFDNLLRSVSVPAGNNDVVLRYQAVPFLRQKGC